LARRAAQLARARSERERERLHSSGSPPTTPAAALVLGGEKAKDGSGGGRGGRPRDGDRVSGGALPPRRRLGAQILELLEGKTAKLGHRVSPSPSNPLCLTRLAARSPLSPGIRILSRAPVLGINSFGRPFGESWLKCCRLVWGFEQEPRTRMRIRNFETEP